jgi:N-acetyl-anhydromuramyl-L-alanine amidase AmpD/peptidoglycan/xylan/chitin deacetylase (PgdA/CDA1 family)
MGPSILLGLLTLSVLILATIPSSLISGSQEGKSISSDTSIPEIGNSRTRNSSQHGTLRDLRFSQGEAKPTYDHTFSQTSGSTLLSDTSQVEFSTIQDPATRIPVLEYHETSFRMSDRIMMTSEWFDEQMRWLAENNYQTLSAIELAAFVQGTYQPPQKTVVLSFDLGSPQFENYTQVIIPTLRKYDLNAIFFLVTSMVKDACVDNYMCWDSLREWEAEGLISVGSHSVFHADYATLTLAEIRQDAARSKEVIESEMGSQVVGFAFPFDSTPANAFPVLESLGYAFALSGYSRPDRSVLFGDPGPFNLPRYYPYAGLEGYPRLSNGQESFEAMLLGAIQGADEAQVVEESIVDISKLVEYCAATNGEVDHYTVDQQAAFETDISIETQIALSQPVRIRPTCTYREGNQPQAVVLHNTEGSYEGTIATFRQDGTSAHYVIAKDGQITQMVPEQFQAFHVSCYGKRSNCLPVCPICDGPNGELREPAGYTIGIELENGGHLGGAPGEFYYRTGAAFDGEVYEDDSATFGYRYWDDYSPEQVTALRLLVEDIIARYDMELDDILPHSIIQQKVDPGPALNLFWTREGSTSQPPIFEVES